MAVTNFLQVGSNRNSARAVRIFAAVLLAPLMLVAEVALAAIVTLGTPAAPGASSYEVGNETYGIVSNFNDGSAPFGNNPGSEELVWLGAHSSWSPPLAGEGEVGLPGSIAVDVTGSGPVSLVLSSAEILNWNVTFSGGVQLNNIFVISLGTETHQVSVNSSVAASLAPGDVDTRAGVSLKRSDTTGHCGFEWDSTGQGCNTEVTLGREAPNMFQQAVNQLEAMQGGPDPLQLTSFNGSYYVNRFDVQVSAQVIPLPAAAWLFLSAIASLGLGRASFRRRSSA